MRKGLWMAAVFGGALACATAGPARAVDEAAQRVSIAPEERAAVRAWLARERGSGGALGATLAARAVPTSTSSTTAPDWLVAHAGPSTPAPTLDPAQLQRGERLPVPVYRLGEPLPPELLAQLPPQPRGTMLLRFDRRLVRVFRPTRTVIDAVDL